MISDTLSMDEHVSLIATIFADKNETEMVRNLSGDDAQAFVDTVDKVMLSTFQFTIRSPYLHVCSNHSIVVHS